MGQDSTGIAVTVDQSLLQIAVEEFSRGAQRLATLLEEDDVKTRTLLWEYAKYLLGEKPRNYGALARYLQFYGEMFLLEEIEDILHGKTFSRLIELGPGTGWLGQRLRSHLTWGGRSLAIDKRDTLFQMRAGVEFFLRDLETDPNFTDLLSIGSYHSDVLVVANQFLHCVENWEEIIRVNPATWLVVEVDSFAWKNQMRRFGADPLTRSEIFSGFVMAGYELEARKRLDLVSAYLWRPK